MIQYQTEKIKMFDVAISTTSSSNALTASDAPPNSTAMRPLVWTSRASVHKALATKITRYNSRFRFSAHIAAISATRPNRMTTRTAAIPERSLGRRPRSGPNAIVYEMAPCARK